MIDDLFNSYMDYLEDEYDEWESLRIYEEEMKMQFMEDALRELHEMTEEQACAYYHTDTKEEARH